MKCPRCGCELVLQEYQGIEVDRCPQCEGMWLDYQELDELEDKVFDMDELKGTTIYRTLPSDINCPKCGKQMKKFNYRFYDLELDFCEEEEHGFWLDKGEEKRVQELMKEEVQRMKRKAKLEEEWSSTLKKLKSRSFFSRLKDLFRQG